LCPRASTRVEPSEVFQSTLLSGPYASQPAVQSPTLHKPTVGRVELRHSVSPIAVTLQVPRRFLHNLLTLPYAFASPLCPQDSSQILTSLPAAFLPRPPETDFRPRIRRPLYTTPRSASGAAAPPAGSSRRTGPASAAPPCTACQLCASSAPVERAFPDSRQNLLSSFRLAANFRRCPQSRGHAFFDLVPVLRSLFAAIRLLPTTLMCVIPAGAR